MANNPDGVIVLGIYMHCQGCCMMVTNSLRGFAGVEEIKTDLKNHKVTVRGKDADPKMVFDRLRKKTGKYVTLISPKLKDKKEEKKEEIKPVQPKVVEVVLKMYMHCEGCAADIKCCIQKMNGVQTVTPDWKNLQVTVKGIFEPAKLVEYVKRKTHKHVEIAKPKAPEAATIEQKNENEGIVNFHTYYHTYPPGFVYAPQLFSDENPNACSIM